MNAPYHISTKISYLNHMQPYLERHYFLCNPNLSLIRDICFQNHYIPLALFSPHKWDNYVPLFAKKLMLDKSGLVCKSTKPFCQNRLLPWSATMFRSFGSPIHL